MMLMPWHTRRKSGILTFTGFQATSFWMAFAKKWIKALKHFPKSVLCHVGRFKRSVVLCRLRNVRWWTWDERVMKLQQLQSLMQVWTCLPLNACLHQISNLWGLRYCVERKWASRTVVFAYAKSNCRHPDWHDFGMCIVIRLSLLELIF